MKPFSLFRYVTAVILVILGVNLGMSGLMIIKQVPVVYPPAYLYLIAGVVDFMVAVIVSLLKNHWLLWLTSVMLLAGNVPVILIAASYPAVYLNWFSLAGIVVGIVIIICCWWIDNFDDLSRATMIAGVIRFVWAMVAYAIFYVTFEVPRHDTMSSLTVLAIFIALAVFRISRRNGSPL
ncbi:hypothetical protein GPK34_04000 [Secundilactobacillus kimchicus]|uniref:hypothetical protein n=1 Tax=Secundilactobacillus kimchicus TaxID=528209 RepID=UPI001C00ED67|nr:hypothetical protein [Secundilactobacillus kimchicus]MBT9671194.1 hypothetical protein [Secundilactobacillus kimchicus]